MVIPCGIMFASQFKLLDAIRHSETLGVFNGLKTAQAA